jgi:hypothetical protein
MGKRVSQHSEIFRAAERNPRKPSITSQVIDKQWKKQDLVAVVRKLYEWRDRLEPDSKQFWQRITKDTVRMNCIVLLILIAEWVFDGEEWESICHGEQ